MSRVNEVRKISCGYQGVAFIGCDTDNDGNPQTATADRIVKTWALTRDGALESAREVEVHE